SEKILAPMVRLGQSEPRQRTEAIMSRRVRAPGGSAERRRGRGKTVRATARSPEKAKQRPLIGPLVGGVAEWFIAAVFKTVGARTLRSQRPRGFKSHRLRQFQRP